MPELAPIPLEVEITDPQHRITTFFRDRWQQLIDGFGLASTVKQIHLTSGAASIPATAAFTVIGSGLYRVSYYMRKTVADGVSSSLQFTFGWLENGVPLTEAQTALALDNTSAQQGGSKMVYSDGAVDLTYAIAYASNTPGAMRFNLDIAVERLSGG